MNLLQAGKKRILRTHEKFKKNLILNTSLNTIRNIRKYYLNAN